MKSEINAISEDSEDRMQGGCGGGGVVHAAGRIANRWSSDHTISVSDTKDIF